MTISISNGSENSSFKFSAGEIQVKTKPNYEAGYVDILANITCSDDVMELFLVTDSVRRQGYNRIYLTMPYLPYSRQDRVCSEGEALSLKVFCDLINSQNYTHVSIWDCHSEVGSALLNNCKNYHQAEFVKRIKFKEHPILVSPDGGALKKIYEVAKQTGYGLVRADKTRDTRTGQITGTIVYSGDQGYNDFLIVDDICDGGRTFIELAKKLREVTQGNIYLYVTHGIFSQGLDIFDGLIDKIYCPNVWPNIQDHRILERI